MFMLGRAFLVFLLNRLVACCFWFLVCYVQHIYIDCEFNALGRPAMKMARSSQRACEGPRRSIPRKLTSSESELIVCSVFSL